MIKLLLKCQACKYEWTSRVKSPKACPRCKSYQWNKEDPELKKILETAE